MSGEAINRIQRKYENHIWSYALLDNRHVYIDVTWGAPIFQDNKAFKKIGIDSNLFCDFNYFDISYTQLLKDHSWNKEIYG